MNDKIFNKARAKHHEARYREAIDLYKKFLAQNPGHLDANYLLGTAYAQIGRLEEAKKYLLNAERIMPHSPFIKVNLGIIYNNLGQNETAVSYFNNALKLKHDIPEAYCNLGNALRDLGRLEEAENSFRRALDILPDFVEVHCNLGNVLRDMGRLEEAEVSYRRALEILPDSAEVHSKLLFLLSNSPASHLEEARIYAQMVAKKVGQRFTAWQCNSQPDRLRVGLVSGDFHNHPVGYFLESLLKQLDPSRVELVAYFTNSKADDLTDRIKPCFSAWKSLVGLDDEAAARLIHKDGVHLLIDLSGHSGNNRLPVFAWKPAPVQVSWLGYFASTGLPEIDYVLADEIGVSQIQRGQFTENIWYLPDTRLCFTPPDLDLAVAELPALKSGYITFGCFQSLAKIGDRVLEVWREILDKVPNARLRLQCKQLGDPEVAAQFVRRLQQSGIEPAQASLFGTMSRSSYLMAHDEVDLILDTFPYPGGTTTCEALWMGVPTVTLAGDSMLSRQGASLLCAAGLSESVTTSEAGYIARAVAMANDLSELSALRSRLRQQVLASPLFDAPRFARNLETALWGMWDRFQSSN